MFSIKAVDLINSVKIDPVSVIRIDRSIYRTLTDRASLVGMDRALLVGMDRALLVGIDRAAVALRRLPQRVNCRLQSPIGRLFAIHISRLPRMVVLLCLLICLVACAVEKTATPTTLEPSYTALEATSTEQPPETPTAVAGSYEDARQRMVDITIEGRGVKDPDVLRAMRTVPRHEFVPDTYLPQAYADHPLPIGYGQTISQPYIVAWMTELLELKPGEKVLEIGTGSGYQAAVLAELGFAEVYSIEIIPELAESAEALLDRLGYDVQVKQGDGYYGWLEYSPFDAIIVTAAPDHLPSPLAAQLVEGGRLVIPIGPPGGYQSLWKFVKSGDDLVAYNMGGVAFVPFTGEGVESGGGSENPRP